MELKNTLVMASGYCLLAYACWQLPVPLYLLAVTAAFIISISNTL